LLDDLKLEWSCHWKVLLWSFLEKSSPSLLAALNLRLADLASIDQGVNAGLRQAVARLVHAKAKGLGFDPILPAMFVIIVGASLLHCLAVSVGVLSRGSANGEGEDGRGDQPVDANFHQIVL
jgi:hypothetical protein